jgi:hypothetical protein
MEWATCGLHSRSSESATAAESDAILVGDVGAVAMVSGVACCIAA